MTEFDLTDNLIERVLLIGGTSETEILATALADAGFYVLVSTATSIPLNVGGHERIRKRSGALKRRLIEELIIEHKIFAIVDAAHPYASNVHALVQDVSFQLDVPAFRWLRPGIIQPGPGIHMARDHEEAASIAVSFGKPVLLTTGSRNLVPYVNACRKAGVLLAARVLSDPKSAKACQDAGIPNKRVITGRGPFSTEDNLTLIKKFNISVIVTKDSGTEGGVPGKLEAAKKSGCQVVVIMRPETPEKTVFNDITALIEAVRSVVVPISQISNFSI